jgi:hypothetical protein
LGGGAGAAGARGRGGDLARPGKGGGMKQHWAVVLKWRGELGGPPLVDHKAQGYHSLFAKSASARQ